MNETVFFPSIVFFFCLLLLFLLVRSVTRLKKRRNSPERRETTEVGFVVDTFHELVAQLKTKERELEVLRRKAEERADVVETYNDYILQSVPSGVISLDSSLTVTRINAAAEKILGIQAEDFVGKGYAEVFGEPLQTLIRSNAVEGRSETQYTTRAGKDIHIGYSLTPLVDARKEIIGRLLVFTDLSELKALEAQAELRDRLSSLGEMAAGMAHELRNPMGVIAGYTKLLSKKLDPSVLHIVDSITREITVMDRIITDFLSFARPAEPSISSVDVSEIVAKCVDHLSAERPDIRVVSTIDGAHPIRGDGILLRQAFTNLVQNAIEAMPHGGELRLGFTADENSVEVTVSDTGHGVPESIRKKIFLPFYTTKEKGTGLGLAIVHKIVVSHRGSVALESRGGATTFRVKLPKDLTAASR